MLKVDPSRKPVLFWDIDLSTFDASKYPKFTIERILEYGSIGDIQWMFENFEKKEIVNVVKNTFNLSTRSAYFWSNILHIEKEEIKCLKKESIAILRKF